MAAKRPETPRVRRAGHKSATDKSVTDKSVTDKSTGDAADLRLLARDAALAALNRLADLSRSDDERVALAATQELLNRAFGKASASGAADDAPASQPLVIKIVRFSDIETSSQGRGDKDDRA